MAALSRSAAQTYNLDRLKAVFMGVVETAMQTFLLLIAVKVFASGPSLKTLLVISGPVGLVINPFGLWLVRHRQWTAAHGASMFHYLAAGGFLVAAISTATWTFVAGSMTGAIGLTMSIPLITQIYQNNYPKDKRGQLFSRTVVVRMLAAAGFSWLGGTLLQESVDNYRWLLLAFAIASAVAGFFVSRMPSVPLGKVSSLNPLHGWRHVREDNAFRWLLISWMLMGFGNLMMLPLRVDFVANPDFGIQLPAEQVALLTGVIPSVAMLLLSPVWGPIFDRYNFYLLRLLLNLAFIVGIACYFLVQGMPGFIIGSICFGIAMSGGNIAWSLWVTKIAKPDDVAEYMSVHTALAGMRGVIAPALGFLLAGTIAIEYLTWFSILLIAAGTIILTPETRIRRRRPGAPVVPRDWD